MSGTRVIHAEVDLAVPVETAWEAWTQPDALARWLITTASDAAEPDKEITWIEDNGVERQMHVSAYDPPRRLAYALHRTGAPADVIEIMFGARGESETNLRVNHSGFICEDPELEAESASSTWRMSLLMLKASLEKHAGKKRATLHRARATGLAVTQLAPWLLTTGGRQNWLPMKKPADPILMTTREVLLPWTEAKGYLEATIVPASPRQTVIALRAHSWALTQAKLDAQADLLEEALVKLESFAAGKR